MGFGSGGRQSFLAACVLPVDAAGHAFLAVDRLSYRVEAATDGWERIWRWFDQYLMRD